MRFGGSGDGRLCSNVRPQAKSGKHQPTKSPKRKKDALDKQSKMLSALSGEPVESSGRGSGGTPASDEGAADVTVIKRASKTAQAKKKATPLEGSIYDHPVIYDWAFGFRDYEAEV